MIITCPACTAQAELPSSKEGAKVKCGECGRVYKAMAGGGRRSRTNPSTDLTRYFIIGGAALLLFGIWMMTRGVKKPGPIKPVEEEVPEVVEQEPMDWDAPAVQFAVELHELAFAKNRALLRGKFDGQLLHNTQRKHAFAAAEAAAQQEGATEMPEPEPLKDFKVIAQAEKDEILNAGVDDILNGDLIPQWKPFDGEVVPSPEWTEVLPDGTYVVRLKVMARDASAGLANRHVEWHLAKLPGGYKAFAWKRWLSPDEVLKEKSNRIGKIEQKTLSDGSQVVEGKIRPIPYMDDTPQEVRDQVEALIDEILDPDSRPSKLMDQLEEIGKPAIPGLLSRLVSIPIETQENIEQLNLIHRTLKQITGHNTTFNLQLMGSTEERQESGIKQWFGWYDRKFKRFTKKAEEEHWDGK